MHTDISCVSHANRRKEEEAAPYFPFLLLIFIPAWQIFPSCFVSASSRYETQAIRAHGRSFQVTVADKQMVHVVNCFDIDTLYDMVERIHHAQVFLCST